MPACAASADSIGGETSTASGLAAPAAKPHAPIESAGTLERDGREIVPAADGTLPALR